MNLDGYTLALDDGEQENAREVQRKEARAVFDYWRRATGHTGARPSRERIERIVARIRALELEQSDG